MPFLYAMWDSESQRIGFRKCTLTGYKLRNVAELIGLLGLLLLIVTILFLIWRGLNGAFHAGQLWWIAFPFSLGFFGDVISLSGYLMAKRKGFRYDWKLKEASWVENGERRFYKYSSDHGSSPE